MIRRSGAGRASAGLFVLALLLAFAVCALVLTLTGAAVYRETAREMEREYETSAALSYVATRLRAHDAAGGISLHPGEGPRVLVLREETGGVPYETWIYCHDNMLRELTVRSGTAAGQLLDSGQALLPASSFQARELRPGLWQITITTAGGETATRLAAVRSGLEEER